MTNTNPFNDNRKITEYFLAKAAEFNLIRVLPVAAISKRLESWSSSGYYHH
jgi:hypothetical protein